MLLKSKKTPLGEQEQEATRTEWLLYGCCRAVTRRGTPARDAVHGHKHEKTHAYAANPKCQRSEHIHQTRYGNRDTGSFVYSPDLRGARGSSLDPYGGRWGGPE